MSASETILATFRKLGPTWIAGAIAAGPATMATLLTAGAGYGYTLLWIVVLSAIFGATGQYLAARLGLFTEEGIVTTVERRLGNIWAWILVVDVILAAGLAQLIIMRTVADVSATVVGEAGVTALADPRIWGVIWALLLAIGLAGGGYRVAEIGAKLLVSGVVIAFIASLFVVPLEPRAAISGLVPHPPTEIGTLLVSAAILGGAVHITLLTMQSYTMRARRWGKQELPLVRVDIATSMLVAFGAYSIAIFLVAATVFVDAPIPPDELTALRAAEALGPLAGERATWLFLLGLWGAAVTTLGANTVVPPYLLADKLHWETDVSDLRYRTLVAVVALASAAGAFIEGALFPLLVLVLAFGLIGTPFALVIILMLLNDPAVTDEPPRLLMNLAGILVLVVAITLAGASTLEQTAAAPGILTVVVPVFAIVMALATVGVVVQQVMRRRVA